MNINFYDSDNYFRLIGIDPGTTHLGVSVYTIEIDTLNILNSFAFTIDASRVDCDTWSGSLHGERFYRIGYICQKLCEVFLMYKPLVICAESPFFGMRHPGAYQALTELLTRIRLAVFEYDNWRELKLVPPSIVKQAVGVKGNADKLAMKEALNNLINTINYNSDIPFSSLDEHSIDALAVGYYAYKQLFNK